MGSWEAALGGAVELGGFQGALVQLPVGQAETLGGTVFHISTKG